MGVEEYAKELLVHLRMTHQVVTRLQREAHELDEGMLKGHLSKELQVVMTVFVKRKPKSKAEGPLLLVS